MLVQDHLIAGFEAWQRIAPVSLGSSGLSDAQLFQARDTWLAWHAGTQCPVERAAAA